ncbi:unnamed protein product [Prorocentrum cordatum]|uniref:Uncharacterized protein n=2 Tax=Prorocentrum cordatum TaxID=2364126 RepID=A0ABN9UU03_9DINO|nr:unnamed protein product [Polarella glacialis]
MAAVRALTLIALASAGAALQVHDGIQHNLTVCNAYAENKPLSVYTVNQKAKLTEEPLHYKACKEIVLELADSERIDFKLGGLSVGTFHVGNLPFAPTSLLLVPYRKGNGTMAATFYSHAFSVAQESSQLAVVDAYDGSAPGALKIAFAKGRAKESAQLKPGTAVNLAPGAYQVSLDDSSSKSVKTVALSATDGGKHVAMRVGGSDGLPQESWCSSRRATPRSAAAPTGPAPLSSLRQRRCAQSCSREAARRVTAAQLRTAAQLQTQRSCRLRAAADAADVIFGGQRDRGIMSAPVVAQTPALDGAPARIRSGTGLRPAPTSAVWRVRGWRSGLSAAAWDVRSSV